MEKKQRLAYYVACVRDFGERFNLTPNDSFAYLESHGGMRFLIDCYEAEHTLSLEDAVADLITVCKRNGGMLG
ncbi:MAG: DUF3791 domain-containing protein [Bacteroidales bacterium]|nr:DUF3791 domain-containing protein [Bacteroidales bacterium]